MTNSADPDQLASSEANWSGSTLFAKTGHVMFSKRRVKVMSSRSVYLAIAFLGMVSPLSSNQYLCNSLTRNWQLPILKQGKGENDHRKYFLINPWKNIAWPGRDRNLQPHHQSNMHLTEPSRPAQEVVEVVYHVKSSEEIYQVSPVPSIFSILIILMGLSRTLWINFNT